MEIPVVVKDAFERAAWTAGQTFLAVLLASPKNGAVDVPWKFAASMAAGAAIVSVLGTILQDLAKYRPGSFWQDMLVRLVKTFIAAFVGAIGARAFDVTAFSWSHAFDIAFLATVSALAKGTLAGQTDGHPSTLKTAEYTTLTRAPAA